MQQRSPGPRLPQGQIRSAKSKRGRVRVRCLGPRPAEHFFMSADPVRQRLCDRCRRTVEETVLARSAVPVRVCISGV